MASFIKSVVRALLILFLAFLLSNFVIFFSISQSIQPEVVKSIFTGLFGSSVTSNADLSEFYSQILLLCVNKTSIQIPIDAASIENIRISCNDVRNGNPSSLRDILAESMFKEVYYKDYNCAFLDCLKNAFNSLFLLSDSARGLLMNFSYIILAVFLVLLLLFMFIIKMKGAASIFLVNGIPSFLVLTRKSIVAQMTQMQQFQQFIPLISSLLYYISVLSISCLGIGVLLLIIPKLFRKKSIKQKKRARKK